MIDDVHLFRGKYIDLCSHVERWATDAMSTEAAARTGKVKSDKRYLFGEKLRIVRDLAVDGVPVFAKPDRVRALMAEFEPFAQMRSDLAHATVKEVGGLFTFDPPDALPPRGGKRFWLQTIETSRIIDELAALKKSICEQKTKPPA